MFCKQGIDISSRGSFEPAKRLRIIVRVLSRNLLLYLLLLLLRPPPPPPPSPPSRCPLSPNALHHSPPPFKPPRHLFYLHYTPNSLLDSVGSASCPSFLTPGFATPLPSLLDLLSLSLFSLLSLCWMATGQFIHRFFLFLFFALFRFSLSRAWKSTHTLRVPPSPSLRRGTLFRGVRVRIPRFCLSNVVPVKVTSDRGTRSLWEADDERS